MKPGKFSAGVMKYHEQNSHAPNAIELRDFLVHSVVVRKGSEPLPRKAESIVEGGLLPNVRNVPSITNREVTHYINSICYQSRKLLEPFCFSFLPFRPTFLEGRIWPRNSYVCPYVTGRYLRELAQRHD